MSYYTEFVYIVITADGRQYPCNVVAELVRAANAGERIETQLGTNVTKRFKTK